MPTVQPLPSGNTLTVPVNQTCSPFVALPGQSVVITGSTSSATATVEFTLDSAATISDGMATWTAWPYSTVTGTTPVAQGVGTPMTVRVTAQTAAVTVQLRPSQGDAVMQSTEYISLWVPYPNTTNLSTTTVNAGTVTASTNMNVTAGLLTLSDGVNIQTQATTGTTIATTTARKAGFHGSASAQAAAYTQTYATPGRTVATATAATLTDNTTGTGTTTLAAGAGISTINFSVNLLDITAVDLVLTLTLGYRFKILSVDFVTTKAVVVAAKAATITTKVNGSAMTGGVLSLTSAACTAGAVVAGTAVTAGNTGTSSGTISLTASAVTAFVEGAGTFCLRVQNMDSADAFASLVAQVNALTVDTLSTKTNVNAVIDDLQGKGISG